MAKSFKLRITRVITTTLQSCRSKDPSTLPEDPVPSLSRLSPGNPNFTVVNFPISKDQNHRPSFKSHVSSTFLSASCGWASKPGAKISSDEDCTRSEPQEFKWQEEEKWHVVAKIYEEKTPRQKIYNSAASGGSDDDDLTFAAPSSLLPPPLSAAEKKKRRGKKKKNNIPSRLRISTSSAESGWFSSEGGVSVGDERDEEETETLVCSSISFSTDSSSEFNPRLHPIQETPFTSKPHRRNKRRVAKTSKRSISRPSVSAADGEIPARLSMFKKLIPCSVDGKVKESFAIVKRSKDPYEDFKNSMTEMILEKQMFEENDLEQLLQCFLSLNSSNYHGIIVQAFSEIWEAIFCPGSRASSAYRRRVSGGAN
ncbi:transcription repressor OFP7-like [Olea europaea var. sylvestris]|uniref:transcription repressor OFP7-like n=1 Tax=Olea europaea var. sylvestris TaxID=158386 RepID=UPI000C1D36A2|nr:transcription repressor OFP7-like [Olea europaea var. sylvestris]